MIYSLFRRLRRGALVINTSFKGEGQAGLNPDDQDEGHTGPNPDKQAEGQAGPNPDVSTQPHPEQMDEGFTTMAYPKVQENLKLTVEEQLLRTTATETTKTTTTTTTTIHPPPSKPQQSTTDSMLRKRIDELEHIMVNLIQDSKHLEERLDSHGARLYILKNLDIPQQMLYEALRKSMNCDHSKELLKDLAEACKKKKKRRDSPKMPPWSPPHQPPPPLLGGPSRASRSLGASGSTQVPPPPPPPPSTNQEDLQMDDDMAPDAQAQSSDDEDIGNVHIPK
nr:hypothetical protein [Tanacetum cinerariifolium]